jgi:hypothetical protein
MLHTFTAIIAFTKVAGKAAAAVIAYAPPETFLTDLRA